MAQQKGSREKIIIVFTDKIKTSKLTPELKTYRRLNLCIEPVENIEKIASKIRYDFNKIVHCTFIDTNIYRSGLVGEKGWKFYNNRVHVVLCQEQHHNIRLYTL